MLLLRRFDDSWMTPPSDWNRLDLFSRRRPDLGKTGGKGRPVLRHALNQQPAAVTGQDVLDQRQPEPGAALRAAVADIDPVEPLGEARQVLRRDAWAEIAHQDPVF